MNVTIDILTAQGTGASYVVPDTQEALQQLRGLMQAKEGDFSRFVLSYGGGQCLNIPLTEVTGINVTF